jgi:hypothetical protein
LPIFAKVLTEKLTEYKNINVIKKPQNKQTHLWAHWQLKHLFDGKIANPLVQFYKIGPSKT